MDLLRAALRVLSCYRDGQAPDPDDLRALFHAMNIPELVLDPEALAAEVAQKEIQRLQQQPKPVGAVNVMY